MLAMLHKVILGRVGAIEKLFQCTLLFTKDESCMFLDEALCMF